MKLFTSSDNEKMVSIVVAAYNVDKFIVECVQSLMNQTYEDVEIICINDCSSDNTKKKLESLLEQNPGLIVINNEENIGVSNVRNKGIELAKGKWICFVDGDDYAAPDMVELMVKKSLEQEADVVIGSYYSVDNERVKYESFYSNNQLPLDHERMQIDAIIGIQGLNTSVGVPWGKLYDRKVLIDNQIWFVPGLKRMQDMVFNLAVFQMAKKIELVFNPVYYYRLHRKSSMHAFDDSFIETGEKIISEIKCFSDRYSKEWESVLGIKAMQLVVEATKLYCLGVNNEISYFSKREYIKRANQSLFKNKFDHSGCLGRNIKEKIVFFMLKNELYEPFFFLCKIKNDSFRNKGRFGT